MKKRLILPVIKYVVPAVVLVLALAYLMITVITLFTMAAGAQEQEKQSFYALSPQVEAFREEMTNGAKENGLEPYINHLLAIMEVSTGGNGTDVMAAGEFDSNTNYPRQIGGIGNPSYSIHCGISEFKSLLQLVGIASPDETGKLLMLYQSYHLNKGFFQTANGAVYSVELASGYIATGAMQNRMPDFALRVERYVSIQTNAIGDWVYPLTALQISCPYGYRTHPVTGEYSLHTGVDLTENDGTPIFAANDGTVESVLTADEIWGNRVVVAHSGVYSTMYAHYSRVVVSPGDMVRKGQVIAYVGSTGWSTGNHLHFEVWKNKEPIDPMAFYRRLEEKKVE